MPLDSPLVALLKLEATLVALLKSATASGGTLSAMPLDSPLLAMLKSATLPNVPLLTDDQCVMNLKYNFPPPFSYLPPSCQ